MSRDVSFCVFHDRENRVRNKCLLLRDEYRCEPDKCEWYLTHEKRIESYIKAVKAYEKNHPGNWMETPIVPERFETEVRFRLTAERLKEEYKNV